MKTTTKCPHCGAPIEEEDLVCQKCEWELHLKELNSSKFIDHVQSPWSNKLTTLAFLLAALGQIFLFLTNRGIDINFIPWHNILAIGHILKTIGESLLLFALLYGLRFEYRHLTINCWLTLLLLLIYHLVVAYMVTNYGIPGEEQRPKLFYFMVSWLVMGELSAIVLGVRLYNVFDSDLSMTGGLMALAALLHLVFNFLLHMSGNSLEVDAAIGLITIFYFWHLKRRLLDHPSYVNREHLKVE